MRSGTLRGRSDKALRRGSLGTWWKLVRMDLLISGVLGVIAFVVLVVWVMLSLGMGEQILNPLIGLFGAPVIRLSRRVSAARRNRSIKRLPPAVPPPPPGP